MKTEIRIDRNIKEAEAVLTVPAMSAEIEEIVQLLEGYNRQRLIGFQDDKAFLLDESKIIRIWAEGDNVFVRTVDKGKARVKKRLFEVESLLDPGRFIRISRFEIISLDQVDSFDLSFSGTIEILFKNGERSYVSRRNVKRLKEVLGL